MDKYVCPDCGSSFAKPQGLGAHRARMHGYRAGDETSKPLVDRTIEVEPTNGSESLDDALLALVFPDGMPAKVAVIERAQDLVVSARELHELTV